MLSSFHFRGFGYAGSTVIVADHRVLVMNDLTMVLEPRFKNGLQSVWGCMDGSVCFISCQQVRMSRDVTCCSFEYSWAWHSHRPRLLRVGDSTRWDDATGNIGGGPEDERPY